MKPIAIVDVDETLWAFHDAVYNTGKEMGITIPKRKECTKWDEIYNKVGKDAATKVFNAVHAHQCSYKPYAESEKFLKYMKSRFYVIIATHRTDCYKPELIEWLHTNKLVYDEVHTSLDKTTLFRDNPRVEVVVDDRDETIQLAIDFGKIGVGLRKPWNTNTMFVRNFGGVKESIPLTLFDTLSDIQTFLEDYNKVYRFDKSVGGFV